MKFIRPLVFSSALSFLGFPAWAEEAHHPKAAASAAKAPKAAPGNVAAKESMVKMDDKMKAMREMHEKMMNAKTPEEHEALMAEHMKTMMGGMSMMGGMGGAGKAGMKGGMSADDMATRQQMMEKRMEMMETTMHMMMDRLPQPPTNSASASPASAALRRRLPTMDL